MKEQTHFNHNKFFFLRCFSYLKYPCNDESFALANAIRVVYEFATGRRLNPTLAKRFLFIKNIRDLFSLHSRARPV